MRGYAPLGSRQGCPTSAVMGSRCCHRPKHGSPESCSAGSRRHPGVDTWHGRLFTYGHDDDRGGSVTATCPEGRCTNPVVVEREDGRCYFHGKVQDALMDRPERKGGGRAREYVDVEAGGWSRSRSGTRRRATSSRVGAPTGRRRRVDRIRTRLLPDPAEPHDRHPDPSGQSSHDEADGRARQDARVDALLELAVTRGVGEGSSDGGPRCEPKDAPDDETRKDQETSDDEGPQSLAVTRIDLLTHPSASPERGNPRLAPSG